MGCLCRAGDALLRQGRSFFASARALLAASRARLAGGHAEELEDAEAALGGAIPALTRTIGAAAGDTYAVRARRAGWGRVPLRLQALAVGLEAHALAVAEVDDAGRARAAADALREPAGAALAPAWERLDADAAQPERIGAYRVVRRLGAGGCGQRRGERRRRRGRVRRESGRSWE